VRRRAFLYGSVATLAMTRTGEAQQTGKVYRVAIVNASGRATEMTEAMDPFVRVVLSELRGLGYTEGKNLVVERRSGEGRRDSYSSVAREVVDLKPDVIVAGSGLVARALRGVTATIPIVTVTSDPIALGLVTQLARPGGNVTGFSIDAGPEVMGKRLGLLKETFPKVSRVAYVAPRSAWEGRLAQAFREAGARAGITIFPALLGEPIGESEYRRVFATFAADRADAFIMSEHGEGIGHHQLIVDLAAQTRLPTVYWHRAFASAGGLMVYAPDALGTARQVAGYVDRILKGAKPGELPFQQPTKFELVINLKTAKALGLTIPPSLLARADQVIE
jgi:putative ABC transport system substrate-binding protein